MVILIKIMNQLRSEGIRAEIYLGKADLKKMLKYADNLQMPYSLIVGDNEIESNKYKLKNMSTTEQLDGSIEEIIKKIVA